MTETIQAEPFIKKSWEPDGPLRHFCMTRISNWTPQEGGGYAGMYVCGCCKKDAQGVYESEDGKLWVCADCKGLTRTKAEQPKHLRLTAQEKGHRMVLNREKQRLKAGI